MPMCSTLAIGGSRSPQFNYKKDILGLGEDIECVPPQSFLAALITDKATAGVIQLPRGSNKNPDHSFVLQLISRKREEVLGQAPLAMHRQLRLLMLQWSLPPMLLSLHQPIRMLHHQPIPRWHFPLMCSYPCTYRFTSGASDQRSNHYNHQCTGCAAYRCSSGGAYRFSHFGGSRL
jgi:hypothetical protein